MKYCMDASALVDLGERHYPEHLKVFEPIWNHIYQGADKGDIISVDHVATELAKKADDWRENFLKRTNGMFLMSEEIELEYSGVIGDVEDGEEFLHNRHRKLFMRGADPWVIALARHVDECTVVSAERKPIADYGLGPVCNALGVRHMNLVQFFEANNIGI